METEALRPGWPSLCFVRCGSCFRRPARRARAAGGCQPGPLRSPVPAWSVPAQLGRRTPVFTDSFDRFLGLPGCCAPLVSFVYLCFVLLHFFLTFFLLQAFPTLKLFHESKLQTPDYAGDRTVDAFSKYLYNKADGVVSEREAGRGLGSRKEGRSNQSVSVCHSLCGAGCHVCRYECMSQV